MALTDTAIRNAKHGSKPIKLGDERGLFLLLQPSGGGTFIVSGATASLRGGARFSAFASAKFALRGLTQSLAREFQPAGVHVTHTILDGTIDSERSRELHSLDP
ncbi:SDR family NAD(P)-dependent oxidoreductase [Altererythrobacter sp. ZODW24]|uniref:SDR family NAD(P)-dependent oxidoreductase n=1 Tax=Altererythrobacter sp. ZODW24 TaxID=2185142 RepID=UPI001964EE55|nr:SDR family NAD(P)-dependent oxidoreductase [Altererythrobacter sp. ZODW24]